MVEAVEQEVEALEQQYLPNFIRVVFAHRPSNVRKIPGWRVDRARFAGREARLLLLGWRGKQPIQPQITAHPQAPGIHIVLRGPALGVFTGVNWIGLREERGNDVLIYSWLTGLEAYEFCATVRGETDFAKCFDYRLLSQHILQQQHQVSADDDQSNSSNPQPYTNPWAGIE